MRATPGPALGAVDMDGIEQLDQVPAQGSLHSSGELGDS